MLGLFVIYFLVAITAKAEEFDVESDAPNICELSGNPMFCNCDDTYENGAEKVTCYLSSNISSNDHIWKGFLKQEKIKSLVLISRPGIFLTHVPSILRRLPDLQHLGIAETHLGVIHSMALGNFSALRSINVERNDLVDMEPKSVANLPFLLKFTASDNLISKLKVDVFYNLPKLEELFLEQNHLEVIENGAFQHLSALKELDLFRNKLLHIGHKTFKGLGHLRRLDLSRNQLRSLKDRTFRAASNLQNLDLSHNQISEISANAFDGLSRLVNLRLKDNILVQLPDKVFLGSPNIISLTITDNRLITFQKEVLTSLIAHAEDQFVIYLRGNPFECRCDMLWVSYFTSSASVEINAVYRNELNSLVCSHPSNSNEELVNISSLTPESLSCQDTLTSEESPKPSTPPTRPIEYRTSSGFAGKTPKMIGHFPTGNAKSVQEVTTDQKALSNSKDETVLMDSGSQEDQGNVSTSEAAKSSSIHQISHTPDTSSETSGQPNGGRRNILIDPFFALVVTLTLSMTT